MMSSKAVACGKQHSARRIGNHGRMGWKPVSMRSRCWIQIDGFRMFGRPDGLKFCSGQCRLLLRLSLVVDFAEPPALASDKNTGGCRHGPLKVLTT